MPELSRLVMHKPGTAQWDLLRPTQVPEATVQMMLVQLVFPADQLHRYRGLARDFRTRFAETPGMDLARIWDARIDHRLNQPGPSALHVFSMILPASLMLTSIQAYRAEWSTPPHEAA